MIREEDINDWRPARSGISSTPIEPMEPWEWHRLHPHAEISDPITGNMLVKCRNSECDRMKSKSVEYCCGPCSHADENHYEIHAHTKSCDDRWSQRRHLLK